MTEQDQPQQTPNFADAEIRWASDDTIDTSAFELINRFVGRRLDPDNLFISDLTLLEDFTCFGLEWETKQTEEEYKEAIRRRLEGLYGFSFEYFSGEYYVHDVARFIDRKRLEALTKLGQLRDIEP